MQDNDRVRQFTAVAKNRGWLEEVGVLEVDDQKMEREAVQGQSATSCWPG